MRDFDRYKGMFSEAIINHGLIERGKVMSRKTSRPVDLSSIETFDNKWFAQVFVGGLLTILTFTLLVPLITPATVSGSTSTVVQNTNK
jgi:hypothetical protein